MESIPSAHEILAKLGDTEPVEAPAPQRPSSAHSPSPSTTSSAAPQRRRAPEEGLPPLRPDLEASLREVADVDQPINRGRLPWLKKAITLACRPFLRRQATFNDRSVAAMRELGALAHLTAARVSKLEAALAENNVWENARRVHDLAAGLGEVSSRLDGVSSRVDGVRAMIGTEVAGSIEAMRGELNRHEAGGQADRAALWERLQRLEEADKAERQLATESVRRFDDTLQTERTALWERMQRLEAATKAAHDALHAAEEARRGERAAIDGRIDAMGRGLEAVEERARTLRAILEEQIAAARALTRAAARDAAEGGAVSPAGSPSSSDFSYFQFELKLRGDAKALEARQRRYVRLLEDRLGGPIAGKRTLDLGCGTGIFADMLARKGAQALGVDSNEVSIAAGRELGRPVERVDLFAALEAAEPNSLDAITAFQVVEHLPPEALVRLGRRAFAALKPGGALVLETINPGSLSALRWYFMDLTHERFLFPEALDHILGEEGFADRRVEFLSEPPAWEKLEESVFGSAHDGALARNFARLNGWLYGPQEYCLSAAKPNACERADASG